MHTSLKNKISLALLVLFISIKMIGLHALAHDDDKDHRIHCTFCEYTVASKQYNAAVLPSDLDYKCLQPLVVVKDQVSDNYSFIFCNAFVTNSLFSRPPPKQV